METPQTARILSAILELQGWNQLEFAQRSGVHRATLGSHLNNMRAIRDEHLYLYLRSVPLLDTTRLMGAWLYDLFSTRDELDRTVLSELMEEQNSRLRDQVSDWSPELSESQLRLLRLCERNLPRDPDLESVLEYITRQLGTT